VLKGIGIGASSRPIPVASIDVAVIPWLATRLEIPVVVPLLGQILWIHHLYVSLLLCCSSASREIMIKTLISHNGFIGSMTLPTRTREVSKSNYTIGMAA
jgi:hypothetical protein